MASRNKTKGTAFEQSLVPLVRQYWPHTIRNSMNGSKDTGDLYMPGNELYIVEAKNHAVLSLPKWDLEARREAKNAGVPFGVVVHKRFGKTAPEAQWTTMTFGDFLALVHRADASAGPSS